MSEKAYGLGDIVDALNDLTRVTVALHGNFTSKAEAIRKLNELSIPAPRIATILSMSTSDVASSLAKAKKRSRQSDDRIVEPPIQGEADVQVADR